MAKLTFTEKELMEDVFDMGGGYVLDFSNRSFSAFMEDVVQYKIYERYPALSKAKMLRQFFKDESEPYVGKTIISLINYMKEKKLINDHIQEKTDKLYEIGKTLLGKTTKTRKQSSVHTTKSKIDYDSLKKSLLDIEKITSAQEKGYAFEKYLNKFFKVFDLDPHASYKTTYDQIDGSFIFNGITILMEAKYRSKEIPKDDLILFEKKIKDKSPFTKGLFITCSIISKKTLEYFNDSSSRIVVLTVEEIYLMCEKKISLTLVLKSKYRCLEERGMIFKHLLKFDLDEKE